LCQVLTQEWAADGINVIIVSPSMIRRPLTYEVYKNNKISKDRSTLIPLGRVGEPTDITNIIGFLLSPDAEYMTG
jgi:3-oxoacyl-[acyl-carrier protein] reductase